METINYEGYEVGAKPTHLTDGTWQLSIMIIKHGGSETATKSFSARNTFPSRDEAIQQCFEFGKRIIDEDVMGCTVEKPS